MNNNKNNSSHNQTNMTSQNKMDQTTIDLINVFNTNTNIADGKRERNNITTNTNSQHKHTNNYNDDTKEDYQNWFVPLETLYLQILFVNHIINKYSLVSSKNHESQELNDLYKQIFGENHQNFIKGFRSYGGLVKILSLTTLHPTINTNVFYVHI